MPSERIQKRIEKLLDEADASAAALDWPRVRDICDGVLRLDPGNQDATAFLEAAIRDTGISSAPSLPAARAAQEMPRPDTPAGPASFVGGRYTVRKFLGEGGKKRVYLAHDSILDRDVAFALIKVEGLDASARARVLREGQVMGRLGEHPNLMPIYDLGTEGDQPYLVMPVMPGGDVEALLQKAPGHRLLLERTVEIATAVLAGLEFAHSRGIIHRDLKPGNIWLAEDGIPRIGDFGLALLEGTRLTQAGLMLGTVAYMSPEQALGGEITIKSDLYSFGCMLYEMVAGRPPFLGEDQVAIIGQHVNTQPVAPTWHNPQCPRPLEALILRLLAKDPAQRPESAADVRSALTAIDIRALTTSLSVADAAGTRDRQQDEGANPTPLDSLAGVFVGRQREIGELRAALEETLSGHGGIVMLSGAPGIGKTRTCLELATYAGLRRCQVLWGRCYEGSGAPPYWPWVQTIRSYVRERDPQQLRSEMGSGAAVIAEMVSDIKERIPDLKGPVPLDSPAAARFRLFDSLTAFLQGASKAQPLVVILDDLQWADKSSLLLLEFIAREMASMRLLIVGNYRDAGISRQHPLAESLGDLNRAPRFQRIVLQGLDRDDVARFIELSSGVRAPRELADAIHTQTEGNPLFVTEVVRMLVQDGTLKKDSGQVPRSWTVRIPAGVREIVGRRLNRLSEACSEALAIGAAIGREFTLEQISTVIGGQHTVDSLLPLMEEALGSRLIEEVQSTAGRYQFAHALVRETLLGDMSMTRRARMHARIAEALERLYAGNPDAPVAELAHHFEAARQVLGPAKVITYSIAAGERALSRMAYQEALEHFERALTAKLGGPGDRTGIERADSLLNVENHETAQLLSGLACAQAATFGRENLQQAVESLRKSFRYYVDSGDAEAAVEAVLRFPFPKVHGTVGVAKLLEEAHSVAEPESSKAGRLLSRMGLFSSFERGEYRPSLDAFSRALEVARRTRDPYLEVHTLANSAVVEWTHLNLDEAVRHSLHAIELAMHGGDAQAQFESHEIASVVLGVLGKTQPAIAHANATLEFAQRLRTRLALTLAYATNAELAVSLGEWDRAREFADRESQFGRLDQRLLTPLLWTELQTGNEERASELMKGLHDSARRWASPLYAVAAWTCMAKLPDGELDAIEEVARGLLAQAGLEPGSYLSARTTLGFIAVARHDREMALKYYSELDGLGRRATPHIGASYDRLRGLLAATAGRHDLAKAHFEDALKFNREARYQPDLAWSCHDYAELLLTEANPSSRQKAAGLVHDAAAIAIQLGMRPLVSKLAALWESVTGPGVGLPAAINPPGSVDPVDPLTGLPGRRPLGSLLALDVELMRTAARDVALVGLDLDGFRTVNDAYGSQAGDTLLREIAKSLRVAAGATSTVARIGGDEFLIVLRNVDPESALSQAATLARAVLNTHVQSGAERIRTSCTAGVVMAPRDAVNSSDLIALTEEALKRAREIGGASVHFYEPREADRKTTTALRVARLGILSALEEDRLTLVRMPIFRVRDRSVEQYEVLVRMKDHTGRLVPPAEFIPQAETLNLIQLIDRRVLELTTERWRAYADAGQSLNLAVNVSALSIGREFLDYIVEQCDGRSVPHERLTFEVTETAMVRDERQTETMVSDLRASGFKVAVDDFGSGATSLKRVKNVAFDYLKLDGSLVRNLATSDGDRQFVVALARLAHDAGLEIVAEFVSNEETMLFLEEQSVEFAQGYYLGEPTEFPAAP